jgi:hydroxyquinol 1,2-dioxygenase
MPSDVLGLSMLVDAINHRQPGKATSSTVEGPFHVLNAPSIANGGNMAKGCPGIRCFVTATVRGLNDEPIAGAALDLWQADGEGLYEGQRHTRGRGCAGSITRSRVAPTLYAE